MIEDQDAIALAMELLIEKCADAAEPLWDEDDFGNPIYVDIGCAKWVHCELFEIQSQPVPTVERDKDGIKVTIQAQARWSHWNYTLIREYYVFIIAEDGAWIASSDFDWSDVSFDLDEPKKRLLPDRNSQIMTL